MSTVRTGPDGKAVMDARGTAEEMLGVAGLGGPDWDWRDLVGQGFAVKLRRVKARRRLAGRRAVRRSRSGVSWNVWIWSGEPCKGVAMRFWQALAGRGRLWRRLGGRGTAVTGMVG